MKPGKAAKLPREKLEQQGVSELTDQDLLAIVLNTGFRSNSCMAIATALMERYGGLHGVAKAAPRELVLIKGIGEAKAATLSAVFELARRVNSAPAFPGKRFLCSADVFETYHARLRDMSKEIFLAIALDNRNRCRKELKIASGGGSSCTVDPREVFRSLLLYKASSVIFVHNHPSGDPLPSRDDRELTARLVNAGSLLGISVLDHIVIGDGRYASFADRGELHDYKRARSLNGSKNASSCKVSDRACTKPRYHLFQTGVAPGNIKSTKPSMGRSRFPPGTYAC
ncbi:MAG: DNA repair protein RadC [Deltaproteobacteria bacterium]|nr:DNA repair protein RadC [Deltaproteobacteria bacterium]